MLFRVPPSGPRSPAALFLDGISTVTLTTLEAVLQVGMDLGQS